MSFHGLSTATSGLAAAQRALETSAHNIANANTEGYTRQRVESSSKPPRTGDRGLLGPGSSGDGVHIEAISRAHDALVTANLREQTAQLGALDTRADFLARAEQVLGSLEEGPSQALADFWNTWEDLSQSPESLTSRDQVLNAANRLTRTITDARSRLELLRDDVGLQLSAKVEQVNDLASQAASYNAQVKAAFARGETPNDLMDRRDVVLRDLAKLTGGVTIMERDGDARVTVGNIALVDDHKSYALSTTGNPPQLQWEISGTPAAASGELGALQSAVGAGTDSIAARLDGIAVDIRDHLNGAHGAGFGLDGISGRALFVGSNSLDIAVDPTITNAMLAASASGAPADGNHALTLGALRSAKNPGGATIAHQINALQGWVGLAVSDSDAQARLTGTVVRELEAQRSQLSGVSTDEELALMLQYQHAYDASARVLTVMDEMLDRLINGTGA